MMVWDNFLREVKEDDYGKYTLLFFNILIYFIIMILFFVISDANVKDALIMNFIYSLAILMFILFEEGSEI